MSIGNPITVVTTATRHMLDANVTLGQSSDRYNARDKYRRSYTDGQRLGAGVGTALGVALPVTAGVAWMQRGMKVPVTQFTNVGRVAGIAGLGVATAVGVKKTIEITKDDGHLGAVGTATGVVAGTLAGAKLGSMFAGKYTPLVSGAGAILGGIAGHAGGSKIKVGESQIGIEHAQAPQVDVDAGDRVGSFARGAFNHFNEVGPTTQGVSFGYAWGMREAVQKQYSNSERAGAMHGDLLAAGILGGGALGVAGGLMGRSSAVEAGASKIMAGGIVAGNVLGRSPLMASIQGLSGKGVLGVGAAGAGIAGVVALKEWNRASDASGGNTANAAMWAGGALAATAGTAALISRSSAFSGMAAKPMAAGSTLAAAAIIGVLSSARMPVQQFMNDAKDAHAANGKVDTPVAAIAGGVGGIGGVVGGVKIAQKLVPAGGVKLPFLPHIPKGAVVAAAGAVAALSGAAVGYGLSATMPDVKSVGMSVAGGAAAGAAIGGFARGVGVVPGIVGGAVLGLSASALLRNDTPAATSEPTPQDVAGAVAG